jgi:hypothetical protein
MNLIHIRHDSMGAHGLLYRFFPGPVRTEVTSTGYELRLSFVTNTTDEFPVSKSTYDLNVDPYSGLHGARNSCELAGMRER